MAVVQNLPVVAVVTDEVRDLAEGLVCDDLLEEHGDDGSFWRWMKRDVDEDLLFLCVRVLLLCVVQSRYFCCFLVIFR